MFTMKNKNKKVLILVCSILITFSAYFFMFSPQAMKSTSVDGTSVSTMRMYKPTKYPFSVKEEFRNEKNEVVEKEEENKNEKVEKKDEDEKLYLMTHFEYPKFSVSIEDFQNYVRKLQENGFLVITAVNPSLLEKKGCFYELALPLKDEKKSILVSLDYNYARKVPTISYVKLPGEASTKDE